VFQLLQSLRVVPIDRIVVAITELGDAPVTIAVASVVLVWLAWHRAWHAVIYGAAAVAGGAGFALLLKVTLQQPRPEPSYAGWNAFSFPSSHTTTSVALYGFLGLLVGREVGMRWRVAAVLTVVLLVSSIAFSRLYLGALWLSDVAAGFAFGLAWIALLGLAYLQHAPRNVRAGGIAAVVGVTLLTAGAVHIALAHGADMQRYAVNQPIRMMPMANWQQGGWNELPVRRVDLLGEYEEPFTMQWAGPLADLRAVLSAAGWTAPVSWTLRSSLEWLSPRASPGSLPVLPRLDRGHSEGLVMTRTAGSLPEDQRLVLRVWRSDVTLSAGATSLPLWIGTIVAERIDRVMWLATVAREEPDMNTALSAVHNALPWAPVERRPDIISYSQWNGFVLLGSIVDHQPASSSLLRRGKP
jgi:undecaprenyl-diphosphatase